MKSYCKIWNRVSRIRQNKKNRAKIKFLKFGTINAYLGVFRLEFEKKLLSIFNMQNVEQNKFSNLGPKMSCYIWRQHRRHEKSRAKQRFFKFGTSNTLFGYFWPAILKKLLSKCNFCVKQKENQIWDQLCFIWVFLPWSEKKLLSYLNSAPLDLPKCKNSCKTKIFQIWDRKCLIWVFLGCNFKGLSANGKSTLSNLPKCKISCKNKNL